MSMDVIHQLKGLIGNGSTTSKGEEAIVAAIGCIEGLLQDLQNQKVATGRADDARLQMQKQAASLQADNDSLRMALHATEMRVARLEGYRERVNEFDPVSDRDAYEDRLPRLNRQDKHDGQFMAANYDSHGNRRPWFARSAS